MKKLFSFFVIILLLCTMCMGLVACNDDHYKTESIYGICGFAVKNEFSFGKVLVETVNFVRGNSPTTLNAYPNRYDIIFENDKSFQPTVDKIQQIYSLCRERMLSPQEFTNIEVLSDRLVGEQSVLREDYSTDPMYVDIDTVKDMEKGYIFDIRKDLKLYVVHETYSVSGYNVVYYSYIKTDGDSPSDRESEYYFATFIYKEGMSRAIIFSTGISFKTDFLLEEIFGNATIEERHEIARYYQPIHREIITNYIGSEQGQKELSRWVK